MAKKVLMIGAHLDDCDFEGGGTALKYIEAGYEVRFLSLCNGSGGHLRYRGGSGILLHCRFDGWLHGKAGYLQLSLL